MLLTHRKGIRGYNLEVKKTKKEKWKSFEAFSYKYRCRSNVLKHGNIDVEALKYGNKDGRTK